YYFILLFLLLLFFKSTPPSSTYTLSLHDALPILQHHPRGKKDGASRDARHLGGDLARRPRTRAQCAACPRDRVACARVRKADPQDRKSTRLNSSHVSISYAVFCLKKKILHRILID